MADPFGIPLLYAYILFYMYGRELRLLRSLELERVALMQEMSAASELSLARAGVAASRKSVWSAAVLADARGSQRALALNVEQSSQRDLPAAGESTATETKPKVVRRGSRTTLAAAEESEAKVARLHREETELRDSLPDVVQKLILGYVSRSRLALSMCPHPIASAFASWAV